MQLRVTISVLVVLTVGCAPRYRTHMELICPPATDSTRIASQMAPRSAITGELTNRDTGRPVQDAFVYVLGSSTFARTDSLGQFQLLGLQPAQYVVRTRQIGYATRTDTVAINSDAGVHMHLALIPSYLERCPEAQEVRTPVPWWHFWSLAPAP